MSTKLMEKNRQANCNVVTTVTDNGQRDKINHYSGFYPKVL